MRNPNAVLDFLEEMFGKEAAFWQRAVDERNSGEDVALTGMRVHIWETAQDRVRELLQTHPSTAMDRKCALSPEQLFRLDLACKPIAEAFGQEPYLVGSAGEKADPRDVDVRLMLEDKKYDRVRKALGPGALVFLGFAIAVYLRDATGLSIDFQIQRRSDANELHPGTGRNPLGGRHLSAWTGDATPDTWRPPVQASP